MKKADIDALVDGWAGRGVVSAEQAATMKAEVAAVTSERSGTNFINAVMYIGATALAMGALLFIASNWEVLTKEVKLVLTLVLPILPLSFAYYRLSVCGSATVLARAANILGMALIGGSIALVGQIYHLSSNLEGFLWMWVLLSTPFLFLFRKPENVLFSAVLTGAAIFTSLITYFERTDLEDGVAIVLTTVAALVYALFLYSLGSAVRTLPSWQGSGRLLRVGAGMLAIVVLFITTFDEYAKEVTGVTYNEPSGWQGLAFVFNIVFIGFLVGVLWRAMRYEEYSFAFTVVRIFGLYLLVKYFTLFYDMMNTGIFFMVGGVLFILGGWLLERNRPALLSYLKDTTARS